MDITEAVFKERIEEFIPKCKGFLEEVKGITFEHNSGLFDVCSAINQFSSTKRGTKKTPSLIELLTVLLYFS